VEENRELLELVQEKDRRIQYLELRIQQLTLVILYTFKNQSPPPQKKMQSEQH
jgi:hypothetical protein